jgi:hypothetical protein
MGRLQAALSKILGCSQRNSGKDYAEGPSAQVGYVVLAGEEGPKQQICELALKSVDLGQLRRDPASIYLKQQEAGRALEQISGRGEEVDVLRQSDGVV